MGAAGAQPVAGAVGGAERAVDLVQAGRGQREAVAVVFAGGAVGVIGGNAQAHRVAFDVFEQLAGPALGAVSVAQVGADPLVVVALDAVAAAALVVVEAGASERAAGLVGVDVLVGVGVDDSVYRGSGVRIFVRGVWRCVCRGRIVVDVSGSDIGRGDEVGLVARRRCGIVIAARADPEHCSEAGEKSPSGCCRHPPIAPADGLAVKRTRPERCDQRRSFGPYRLP